ncbi:MAG: ATP-binding protein [Marinoscillum sp.]
MPEIPTNEKKRLQSLKSLDLLDSLPEVEFDNITKLASQITEMPISLITLVDETRQWFKSKVGMEETETPRDWAFCAHAINQPDEAMVVNDTYNDERFKDNPLTEGKPFIRFYAGMPFKDMHGNPLGTLCVIDDKPNELTADKLESLKILAKHVSTLIQLRTTNLKLAQGQEQYQRSRENIVGIIENTDDAIWSVDKNLNFIIINGVYSNLIYQLTGEEPKMGQSAIDRGHVKFDDLKEYYDRSLAGEKFAVEYQLEIHGERAVFKKYFNPILNDKGEITGVSVFARQITEEKLLNDRAERYRQGLQLLNKISSNRDLSVNAKIREALELTSDYLKMPIGFLSKIDDEKVTMEVLYDHFRQTTFNEGMTFSLHNSFAAFVYEKGETLGLSNLEDWSFKGFTTLLGAGVKSCVGAIVPLEDSKYGTINFASTNEKPFDTDETDFVNLLAGWVGSILEREHYENRLIAEKDTLKAFVKSAPAAIAMFNEKVEYLAASVQWNQEYFLDDKELVGLSHYEVFPEINEDWKKVHQSALNGEVIRRERDLFRRADGEKQWIQWEVRPWYDGQGSIGGIIMFTEDVTYQVLQEQELKIARDEAERASHAKDLFLSTMSHEIRTPMNAIIGISNILIDDEPKPEQFENLKLLKFSSSNLLTLINDILDFNKIEAGKMDLEEIDFNLKEVASSVYQILQLRANEKDLVVFFDYDRGLPEYFKGDPVRITQILTNLLSNAIKFTESGFVRMEFAQKEKTASDVTISVKVTDTGVGIPTDKLTTIFENFTQASSSVTRKFGGTGLGLSICKKLLNLMESEIYVESEEGKGSVFFFDLTLPIGEVKSLDATYADLININHNSGAERIRLLIAEDHDGNQKVLSKFLDRWAIKYDFANDGAEAVQMVQQRLYSMILMDIQMPVMDGFESARRIRALGGENYKTIPIFALTASVLLGVQEQVVSSGMNGYVGKPFDPDDLYAKIMNNAIRLAVEPVMENLIDQDVIEKICLGDEVFENYLKNHLFEQLRLHFEKLKESISKDDKKSMRSTFLHLKELNKNGAIPIIDELYDGEKVNSEVMARMEAILLSFD